MKYLGVGLSRTGTLSLCRAFQILGFNALHWAPERLIDVITGANNAPDFKRYDDVDVVADLPAAYFYRELKVAYPACKLILTVRDADSWYDSLCWHYQNNVTPSDSSLATQKYVYGSDKVCEFLYKKRFLDFNRAVMLEYSDTLIMNIVEGDGWDKLCPYVGLPVPSVPFPKENVRWMT